MACMTSLSGPIMLGGGLAEVVVDKVDEVEVVCEDI